MTIISLLTKKWQMKKLFPFHTARLNIHALLHCNYFAIKTNGKPAK